MGISELDMNYIAIRFNGGMSSGTVRSLLTSDITENYRDIGNFDFIASVVSSDTLIPKYKKESWRL